MLRALSSMLRRPLAAAVLATAGLAAGAAPGLAQQSQPLIRAQIEPGQISPGVPGTDVVCEGIRRDNRPVVACEIRFDQPINVTGTRVVDRGTNREWTSSFRPFDPAQDDTAMFVLIDRGDTARAETVRRAVRDLSEAFQRPGQRQRVAVGTFANNFELLQDFTANGSDVTAAFGRIQSAQGSRELYRVALEAIRRLSTQPSPRRVLFIASDGRADDRATTIDQVIRAAIDARVRIVGIGYAERAAEQALLQPLRRMSQETFGQFIEVPIATREIPRDIRGTLTTRFSAGGILEAVSTDTTLPRAIDVRINYPEGRTANFGAALNETTGVPQLSVFGGTSGGTPTSGPIAQTPGAGSPPAGGGSLPRPPSGSPPSTQQPPFGGSAPGQIFDFSVQGAVDWLTAVWWRPVLLAVLVAVLLLGLVTALRGSRKRPAGDAFQSPTPYAPLAPAGVPGGLPGVAGPGIPGPGIPSPGGFAPGGFAPGAPVVPGAPGGPQGFPPAPFPGGPPPFPGAAPPFPGGPVPGAFPGGPPPGFAGAPGGLPPVGPPPGFGPGPGWPFPGGPGPGGAPPGGGAVPGAPLGPPPGFGGPEPIGTAPIAVPAGVAAPPPIVPAPVAPAPIAPVAAPPASPPLPPAPEPGRPDATVALPHAAPVSVPTPAPAPLVTPAPVAIQPIRASRSRGEDDGPPLAVLEFDGGIGRVPVRKKTIVIGRHTDDNIRLDDISVSRHHADLWVNTQGRFEIRNRTALRTDAPPNRMLINGVEQERAEVKDGDQVTLGNVSFTFRSGAGNGA